MADHKNVSQMSHIDGSPAAPATSAPGWFVHDGCDVLGVTRTWGTLFSEPQKGNKVEFLVGGGEYFKNLADALMAAKESVYILGWQVNFDVELVPGTTPRTNLFHCLDKAMNNGANIYVMPWLSPKVGVDTGDLETTLALFQLNAGREGGPKAYVLPAMAQSDMDGALGIFFSHHQKLVVIDNKIAFVGGIDLAYGRRDDGNYSLKANGRKGPEIYNSCIPPIRELNRTEQRGYMTRAELLGACFDTFIGGRIAWWSSESNIAMATVRDTIDSAASIGKELQEGVAEWWNEKDLVPEMVRRLQDSIQQSEADAARRGISAAGKACHLAWDSLPPDIRGKLQRLRDSGAAHATSPVSALLAWLNGANLNELPPELFDETADLLQALTVYLIRFVSSAADARTTRYENIVAQYRMLPAGATTYSDDQPRMPWHDIQARIEGPAVCDLARNFTRRWNGLCANYEQAELKYARLVPSLKEALRALIPGVVLDVSARIPKLTSASTAPAATPSPAPFPVPRLPTPPRPAKTADRCWVQTLRSAPKNMQMAEFSALNTQSQKPQGQQDNCLKAMVQAIGSAQNFLYIEGQFFQSAHGAELVRNKRRDGSTPYSGPMGVLCNIRYTAGYQQYAQMLGIENAWQQGTASDILSYLYKNIRWEKVDDVRRDRKRGNGERFWRELKSTIATLTQGEFTCRAGKVQKTLLNPVLNALLSRVERAIRDDQQFHVYLVLPVHPEGNLNTLNIMHQTHLTMQSLSFGENSLINGTCRAILAKRTAKEKGITYAAAKSAIAKLDIPTLRQQTKEAWRDHLTLMNLRNWDVLNGRPITEQIYVHSKLLIADDTVAILGSANINDRSQEGDRDSELAVIVRDDDAINVALTGQTPRPVSRRVHDLRKRLWKRIFGLDAQGGQIAPARSLESVIEKPGDPATWKAIQQVANKNAETYEKAFWHVPRDHPPKEVQGGVDKDPAPFCSLWPTWQYVNTLDHTKGGRLVYHMPFDEAFWRNESVAATYSWSAKQRAPELKPSFGSIQGYIVSLPIYWTFAENNASPLNLAVIALAPAVDGADPQFAQAAATAQHQQG